jgi:hypothetical protein
MTVSTDFYFEIIKKILDQSISSYCLREKKPIPVVDSEIAEHIKNTSPEYQNPDPDINYDEPLCRLGYLFKHAGANATLFERTIDSSSHIKTFISSRTSSNINICTVGGGPGTELLGLTKYLLNRNVACREIHFTVLDNVPEWSETWTYIANESQNAFLTNSGTPPIIHKMFIPMDVVEASSYKSYAWLFEKTDLVIFNYLLSENKVRLPIFANALDELILRTPSGCYFAVIDRLEHTTTFRQDVINIFSQSGLKIHECFEFDGVMSDYETPLGDYPTRFKSHPRKWFRTPDKKYPTVFSFVAQKT